jgi:hypothetical protein
MSATTLYDVTGYVEPEILRERTTTTHVNDTAGDRREIGLCWGNVGQGYNVYVQAQVAATCEIQAVDLVAAALRRLVKSNVELDADDSLSAEPADADCGY